MGEIADGEAGSRCKRRFPSLGDAPRHDVDDVGAGGEDEEQGGGGEQGELGERNHSDNYIRDGRWSKEAFRAEIINLVIAWSVELPSIPAHQPGSEIKRTFCLFNRPHRYAVGIDHRCLQAGVTELRLDRANVVAALQEVCGKGITEGVGSDTLRNASFANGFTIRS